MCAASPDALEVRYTGRTFAGAGFVWESCTNPTHGRWRFVDCRLSGNVADWVIASAPFDSGLPPELHCTVGTIPPHTTDGKKLSTTGSTSCDADPAGLKLTVVVYVKSSLDDAKWNEYGKATQGGAAGRPGSGRRGDRALRDPARTEVLPGHRDRRHTHQGGWTEKKPEDSVTLAQC